MVTMVNVFMWASYFTGYKRVCYHTNWAQYRPNPYNFTAESIDPHVCTHIIYAFGKVSGNTIKPYEWNDESDKWSTGKIFDIKSTLPLWYIIVLFVDSIIMTDWCHIQQYWTVFMV